LRLYYDDSYLIAFQSTVTKLREDAAGTWVCLAESAFYPESGGQPADRGTLNGVAVQDVQVDDAGDVWHLVAAPVSGAVAGSIDFGRRFDHMQQHAAQHIASQALFEATGRETISFHIGEAFSTFDLDGRAAPTEEALLTAEQLANRVVQEDREIVCRWVDKEELPGLGLRAQPKVASPYRIVAVRDFDICPCGGTHPRRTGEIGLIKLFPAEPEHEGFRIRLYAGGRALRDYGARAQALAAAAAQLAVAPPEVPSALRGRLEELATLHRAAEHYRKALLDREADDLAARKEPVFLAFPGRDPQDLRDLAPRLAARGVPLVALVGTQENLSALVLQRPQGDGPNLGAVLRALTAAFGGKGGGSPVAAQGALPLPAAELIEEVERRLRA